MYLLQSTLLKQNWMLIWNGDNGCRCLRSYPDPNTLISPNLGNWQGKGKRRKPLHFCCRDLTIGVEGIKYITLKKYFSLTAFVLFMAGLVTWLFCLWSLQQTGNPMSGASSWFYSCWDSCKTWETLFLPLSHIFSPENKGGRHNNRGIRTEGCPLILLQREAGTTSLPPCLCFFHILKYRRFPLGMRKDFLLWGCWALSLQLSSGRPVSRCFSSKHFWQKPI